MDKERISGYPYELERKDEFLIIRFIAKKPNSIPDPVFVLKLNDEDRKKLIEILS